LVEYSVSLCQFAIHATFWCVLWSTVTQHLRRFLWDSTDIEIRLDAWFQFGLKNLDILRESP